MPPAAAPSSSSASVGEGANPGPAAAASTPPAGAQQRSTLADWAATEDDGYFWGAGEKRQRGGRKRRNKKQQQQGGANSQRETDWDEIYDPARPTNVDEYLRSEERIREVQDWKAVLYAHRRKRRRAGSYEESSEEEEGDGRLGIGSELLLFSGADLLLAVLFSKSLTTFRFLQTSLLLRPSILLHHRPCPRRRHPGTHQPPPCRTTRQATTPTHGGSHCQAWRHHHQHTPQHRHLPLHR